MKRRDGEGGGSFEKKEKKNWGEMHKNSNIKKKRNESRLGGGKALSLEAFANAKDSSSSSSNYYNPSLLKKQREFYKNAKFVGKFKKSIKREGQLAASRSSEKRLEDGNKKENKRTVVNNKKNRSALQSIREEFEKKQAEAEKEKMEREAMIQAKKEERARAEGRRKAQRDNMFKKTRSGQPVMKYRIQHLLQGILEGSSS